MASGSEHEDVACRFLERHGLRLRERNWRLRHGEIDLVMEDGAALVFVEVKYRSTDTMGLPIEAVDRRKQQRIRRLAAVYLAREQVVRDCRFDVVGILGDRISWVKGAF